MSRTVITLLIFGLLLSCRKSTKEDESAVRTAYEIEREVFFSNLRSPGELAAQLERMAADFNPKLLSDPNNYATYTGDENKAAANLGIYLSDLNYCIAYRSHEHITPLFTAVHELGRALGIEKSILSYLMIRYNENIENNDSVKFVVDEMFRNSTNELKGTRREKLAGIVMAAYQIENLHLATGVILSYPKDMLPYDGRIGILIPLFKVVLDQRSQMETVYSFLKAIGDPLNPEKNPNYAYYSNAFEELIEVYERLNAEERIASNQGSELLKDEVIEELSQKVNAIRDKVIGE